jgi:5S rRNA maturation endonuclease (ribonuclease M5)
METETQEASQESTEVTDEMLDRAADGVDEVEEVATEDETTEETTEEEVEKEVAEEEVGETASEEAEDTPEEPEDNAERSRLGRRVSELEGDLLKARQESQASTDNLNETLKKLTGLIGKNEEPAEEEFFELPETKADLDKLIKESVSAIKQEESSQITKQSEEYSKGYIDTVMSLIDDDPEGEAILKLLEDDFNTKHSKVDTMQGGVMDAAKNIMAAKSQLSQGTVKKIPLKGEKPRAPLGGGGGDKIPKAAKKMPKLDATAAAYVKETGMSDDDVIRVFG